MENNNGGDFKRVLGPWSAAAIIAGSMIGTGIFFFVSDVAVQLPSAGLIIAAWVVGMAIASCGALTLAELASTYPETGGIYVFLRRAYGPFIAFLYSWAEILIMRAGSFAILALAFGRYTGEFIGIDVGQIKLFDINTLFGFSENENFVTLDEVIAIGVILVLTAVNMVGVRFGGGVQNVFTATKIVCLLLLIGVGGLFALGGLEPHPVEIEPGKHAEGGFFLLFGLALIPIMWSIGGWDEAPFVAEEIRNPQRNLPLAILGGLWTVAALYILANLAYLAILTPAEVAGSSGGTAAVAMKRALGEGVGRVLALAIMISAFGAANGLIMTGGRLAYAAGRDRGIFQWLGRTNPRTKTPVRGLAFQAILTVAAILVLSNPFALLLYTGLAYWTFAALTGGAVLVLRGKDPEKPRPFKTWGYPVTPILFMAAAICMSVSVIVYGWQNALATYLILSIGAVVYAIQSAFGKKS